MVEEDQGGEESISAVFCNDAQLRSSEWSAATRLTLDESKNWTDSASERYRYSQSNLAIIAATKLGVIFAVVARPLFRTILCNAVIQDPYGGYCSS